MRNRGHCSGIALSAARVTGVRRRVRTLGAVSDLGTRWPPPTPSIARLETADAATTGSRPNNIEAEQALLGAILVNNDAFYRVSDFLEPAHFFEPLHRAIYEVAGELIRAGKVATPITLKTFLRRRRTSATSTVAAISRPPRGRGDHRHQRRGLRPHDLRPRHPPRPDHASARTWSTSPTTRRSTCAPRDADRGGRAAALRARRDRPLRRRLPALRRRAARRHRHGRRTPIKRDGKLSGIATGLADLDRMMGGLQPSDLIILAGRPGMGKTALATNIAFNIAKAYERRAAARRRDQDRQRRHRRLLLARNVGRAARHPHHRRADRASPPTRSAAATSREDEFDKHRRRRARDADDPALHRPDRRHLDRPARRARAAPEAPARPRPARRRLPPAARRARAQDAREPRAGGHRDHHRPEGAGQGARRADHRAVAALAPGREPRRQAPAALRPARIGLDRAGRRRGAVRLSARNIT